MRCIWHLLLLMLWVAGCGQSPDYEIAGTITGIVEGKIYLGIKDKWGQYGVTPLDSAIIRDGSFHFKGSLEKPALRYLKIEGRTGSMPLFITRDEVTLKSAKDSFPKAAVTGSALHERYKDFRTKQKALKARRKQLRKSIETAQKNGRTEVLDSIGRELNQIQKQIMSHEDKLFRSDAAAPLKLYVYGKSHILRQLGLLDSLYQSIDSTYYNTLAGKRLKNRVEKLWQLQPGKPFVDFTATDTAGNKKHISNYLDTNYVLLYFRNTCPYTHFVPKPMRKIHKQFHDKGLQIIGIFTDADPLYMQESAKKAPWPFLAENDSINSTLDASYGGRDQVYYYLVSPENKYVDKFLRPEKIRDTLSVLLDSTTVGIPKAM